MSRTVTLYRIRIDLGGYEHRWWGSSGKVVTARADAMPFASVEDAARFASHIAVSVAAVPALVSDVLIAAYTEELKDG